MTFKKVERILGKSLDIKNWSQTSQGGWVENTASATDNCSIEGIVYESAHVYGDACIYENAVVRGNAVVCGDANIYGNAHVYENASIYGNARVYGDAIICGDAVICGNAVIYGNASIHGNAHVYKAEWKVSPLYIQGTIYSLTNCSPGKIRIGCMIKSFEEWKEQGEKIAAKHNFTKEQIEEYRAYIELFCKIGR